MRRKSDRIPQVVNTIEKTFMGLIPKGDANGISMCGPGDPDAHINMTYAGGHDGSDPRNPLFRRGIALRLHAPVGQEDNFWGRQGKDATSLQLGCRPLQH